MDREEVMQSISLKKRFCKDNNLPIVVYDNPYFFERLRDLDILFGCVEKFATFCAELESYTSEQEYFEYYNCVKDSAINKIKNSDGFTRFIANPITELPRNVLYIPLDVPVPFSEKNLYIEDNDGGSFISIDMKKANFTALHHFSAEIFDGYSSWEEFIGQFTGNLHIINSKYIRQVIMGACNPKRQIQYERLIMCWLCKYLLKEFPNLPIYSVSNDEIIIKVKGSMGFSLKQLRETVSEFPILEKDSFRVSSFELSKIDGTTGWLKTYNQDDGKIEFKCLSADIYNQVIKYYFDKPISTNDLVFYYNGRLARFLNPISNPWE